MRLQLYSGSPLDLDDGANTLIHCLLEAAQDAAIEGKINILLFAARGIALLRPRLSLVQEITLSCLQTWIAICVNAMKTEIEDGQTITEIYTSHNFFEHHDFGRGAFMALAGAPEENQHIVAETLQKHLTNLILSADGYERLVASEIALNLVNVISHTMFGGLPSARWKKVEDEITKACLPTLKSAVAEQSIRIATDLFNEGLITLQELVKWHGTKSLLVETHRLSITNIYDGEIAPTALSDLMDSTRQHSVPQELIHKIQEIGRELLKHETPWITMAPSDNNWMVSSHPHAIASNDSDFLFGLVIILCFLYERWYQLGSSDFEAIEEFETPFSDYFKWIFIARLSNEYVEDIDERVEAELARCQFSHEQKEFIRAWSAGSLYLIG